MVSKAFVRAKSSKISVIETYSYKAEISDHASLSFLDADGEIKAEFLYDGEFRDSRWKVRVFWEGLCDKWIALGKFNNWWKRSWRPLRWLYKQFEQRLLGKNPGQKYFNMAAIEDTKKYEAAFQTAQVGHLALRGYQKPNFVEDWSESKTLKLEIPIDNSEEKLAQSQKYTANYKYPLLKPQTPPVRLQGARLTDEKPYQRVWIKQENDHIEELYSKNDELMQLEIELEVEGGQPGINAEDKVPDDLIRRWWYRGKKLKVQQENQKSEADNQTKDENDEETQEADFLQEQTLCIESLEEVENLAPKELSRLGWRGGYLLVRLDNEDQMKTLQERMLKVALSCDPFVPILKPYHRTLDDRKPLAVIPVHIVSQRQSSYRRNHLTIESNLQPSIGAVDAFLEENDTNGLAQTLSSLANASGGLVFLKAQQSNDEERLNKALGKATSLFRPHLDREDTPINPERYGRDGWIISIERASSNVYSVNGNVYKWRNNQPEALSVDETYAQIKERCFIDYPLMMARPVVSYAYIKWPRFDAREASHVRYDPEKQIIKWIDRLQFGPARNHIFEGVLPLQINRPIELYKESMLTGELHIDLEGYLWSGLDVHYFNGLGERRPNPQGGPPIIEKKSKVIIQFDIQLAPIFHHREFTTKRKLEFEGVKPDNERLKDIMGMLASLGLEDIRKEPKRMWRFEHPYLFIKEDVEKIMNEGGYLVKGRIPGLLWVELHVQGEAIEIIRERIEGDRSDEMSIQAGKMHITINGRTTEGGVPQELLNKLNHLQQLLTERFMHIRNQVA